MMTDDRLAEIGDRFLNGALPRHMTAELLTEVRQLRVAHRTIANAIVTIETGDYECWCPDANREIGSPVSYCPRCTIMPAVVNTLRAAVRSTP